jgi:hypothetical protein
VKAVDDTRTAFSALIVTCTDMFTKLKNKIAEEVKQSPLKLSASVQQLTQVCSLYLANVNLLSELFSQLELLFDCLASECDNSVS